MILRRRGFAMLRRNDQRAEHPIVNAGLDVPYERRLGSSRSLDLVLDKDALATLEVIE